MKKTVVMILLASFIATMAFSVSFGIGAGGTIGISSYIPSKEAKKELDAFKMKPAFGLTGGAGVVARVGFTDALALQPEVNVIFGNTAGSYKDKDNYSKMMMTSIELPVLLKYRVAGGFSLLAGPTFSFGVGKVKTVTSLGGKKNTLEMEAKDAMVSTFAIGMQIGFDYALSVGPGDLLLGARYGMNFTDISSDKNFKTGLLWNLRPTVSYVYNF